MVDLFVPRTLQGPSINRIQYPLLGTNGASEAVFGTTSLADHRFGAHETRTK